MSANLLDFPENISGNVQGVVSVMPLKQDPNIHRQVMHGIPFSLHVINAVNMTPSAIGAGGSILLTIWEVAATDTQESSMKVARVIVKVPKAFTLVGAAAFPVVIAIDRRLITKSSVHGKNLVLLEMERSRFQLHWESKMQLHDHKPCLRLKACQWLLVWK